MRSRLTYANVMSTIAVFMAVGLGGAWAADKLKKNSVSSKQVKNESIVSKDLKNGKAVTGDDVTDESLAAADVQGLSTGVPQTALALGNGGEGDCLWVTPPGGGPVDPAGSSVNVIGEVRLNGVLTSIPGPGGDTTCDLTPNSEGIEDLTIFVLPPGQRPASLKGFPGGPEAGIIIAGVNGASLGGAAIPPGAVLGQTMGPSGVVLDGVSFVPASPAALSADGKPDRIDPSLLGLDD